MLTFLGPNSLRLAELRNFERNKINYHGIQEEKSLCQERSYCYINCEQKKSENLNKEIKAAVNSNAGDLICFHFYVHDVNIHT